MENKKILAVIGHHSAELEFGRLVKTEFENLKRHDNINWIEIKDSPIDSNTPCPYVIKKVCTVTKRNSNIQLIIDIHCHPYYSVTNKEVEDTKNSPYPKKHFYPATCEPHSFYSNNIELTKKFKERYPQIQTSYTKEIKELNESYEKLFHMKAGPSEFVGYKAGVSTIIIDPVFNVIEKKYEEQATHKVVQTLNELCKLIHSS